MCLSSLPCSTLLLTLFNDSADTETLHEVRHENDRLFSVSSFTMFLHKMVTGTFSSQERLADLLESAVVNLPQSSA